MVYCALTVQLLPNSRCKSSKANICSMFFSVYHLFSLSCGEFGSLDNFSLSNSHNTLWTSETYSTAIKLLQRGQSEKKVVLWQKLSFFMTGRDLSQGSLCEKVLRCPSHTLTPHSLSVGSCVGWLRVTEPVTAAADNSPSQSLRWRVSLIFFFSSPSLEAWSLFTLYTARNLSGFNTLSVFCRPPGWPLSHQLPVWKVASHSCFSQYCCNYFHPELVIRPPAVGSHSSS